MAVDLSPANLLDTRLPTDVAALLERFAVPAGALRLEITEDTVMIDPERALDVIGRLGALGISFALDDFGTGYSSLAYRKRLPVAELKIDKSFVLEMTGSADDATIVRSTVDLGRAHARGKAAMAALSVCDLERRHGGEPADGSLRTSIRVSPGCTSPTPWGIVPSVAASTSRGSRILIRPGRAGRRCSARCAWPCTPRSPAARPPAAACPPMRACGTARPRRP